MSTEPLVTCLCLTMKGREDYLTKAIDCFIAQTYPRRELLIVADSSDDLGKELGPNGGQLPAPAAYRYHVLGPDVFGSAVIVRGTIARKRNCGCQEAAGEIICTWDDDDYSAPDRLTNQVASLQISGKAVTGFQLMKFTDGSSWWQFGAAAGIVIGTSLCFRRDWWEKHPFETESNFGGPLLVGEDVRFCDVANSAGQLASCPDSNLMYATIHPGNTSPRNPRKDPGWVELPGFEWKD